MARRFASTNRTLADEHSYWTGKVRRLFAKLESNRHLRYEDVLDEEEMALARHMLRTAINHTSYRMSMRGARLPKTVTIYGRRYGLRHTMLGRVSILNKRGEPVLASQIFAL